MGQEVLTFDLEDNKENTTKINVAALTNGLYVIKAESNGALYQNKFVKN